MRPRHCGGKAKYRCPLGYYNEFCCDIAIEFSFFLAHVMAAYNSSLPTLNAET